VHRRDPRTLAEVLSGALEADAAVADGGLEVEGAAGGLDDFLSAFSFASE
jgi:hypothetical protein